MLLQHFKLLPNNEQEEAIWKDGIFVAHYCNEDIHMCDVYTLFGFYVSFCYELKHSEKAIINANLYPDQLPYLCKNYTGI